MDEPFKNELRELALSALRTAVNHTGHTPNCMEMRAMGVKTCTKACSKFRAAIERLTGEPVPGADWPGELGPTSVPDICRACGETFNFGGGFCVNCGAPYMPAADPLRPHRLHLSLTVATEELPDVLRSLLELASGRQPSYGLTPVTEGEEPGHAVGNSNAKDQGLVE